MSNLEQRAERCVTHHHACDCREYAQQERIAELEAEVERMENLLAEGIHTCNPTCKRPLCVLRRENKALREAAEALVKSGFRVEREDFSTNVDSAKFDALQAALGGGGDE